MKIKRSDFRMLGCCPDRVSYIKDKHYAVILSENEKKPAVCNLCLNNGECEK